MNFIVYVFMLLVGVIDQTLTLTLTSGSEYELSVFKVILMSIHGNIIPVCNVPP